MAYPTSNNIKFNISLYNNISQIFLQGVHEFRLPEHVPSLYERCKSQEYNFA